MELKTIIYENFKRNFVFVGLSRFGIAQPLHPLHWHKLRLVKQVAEVLSQEFPAGKFKEIFNREKPTPETEIIFHCRIGVRSQTATDLCYQLGYNKWGNAIGTGLQYMLLIVIHRNLIKIQLHDIKFNS